MPARTEYADGVPNWIDIGSPDIPATKAFYGALLGWDFQDLGEEAGGYSLATIGGAPVAGIGPAQNPGPPFWATYINVDDVQVAHKKLEAAGATTIVAPMDVMTAGKMAVYFDVNGAAISTWQKLDMIGASVVNEHGALCWNELNTWKLDAAKKFYAAAFGWEISDNPEYGEFSVGGRVCGGMMPMSADRMSPETPEHWLVYFAVNDVHAAHAKIGELGGTAMMPPFEAGGVGMMTVAMDPLGAVFAVIQLNEPGE
jgi:predicted enzyme related to lactoylglutathione lyase